MKDAGMIATAFRAALKAHAGQKRKGTDIPYVVHPLEVGIILLTGGYGEEMVAAGLLHDTLEDTDMTEKELERVFGRRVLSYVVGASEVLENRSRTAWKERKTHTVRFLADAPREIKLISCADKLSNIRSVYGHHPKEKDSFWNRFNAGYEDQKWYYQSLVHSLSELGDTAMYKEFKQKVEQVFGA